MPGCGAEPKFVAVPVLKKIELNYNCIKKVSIKSTSSTKRHFCIFVYWKNMGITKDMCSCQHLLPFVLVHLGVLLRLQCELFLCQRRNI